MRISLRKFVLIILFLIVGLLIYLFLREESPKLTHTCNQTEQFQVQLHQLSEKVHELLRLLDLTHFLCYGALWGQIRLSRTMPWAEKAEFCLLNEELAAKDEVFLVRFFRKSGLTLEYDSTDGQYTVTGDGVKPKIILVVFELDKLIGMYRRIGWKRRVLPPDCENIPLLECFPPRLAQPPLPLKEFGHASIPVPREEIELQKYHYRDSWWKETVQFNC